MKMYETIKDIPYITGIFIVFLSFLSTIIRFSKNYNKYEDKTIWQKFLIFMIEFITSFTIAIITFFSLVGWGFNETFSVGLAGFAATQGTNIMLLGYKIIVYKLFGKQGLDDFSNHQK
jgi:hypothetical protein